MFDFLHMLNDFPGDFVPMMAMVLVFGIPIIAILTAHQRKMAELIHGQSKNANVDGNTQRQIEYLTAQVGELRGLIQEHIINNDRTTPVVSQTPPPVSSIEQRLNS